MPFYSISSKSLPLVRIPPSRRFSLLRGLWQRLRKPPLGADGKKKPNLFKFKYRLENWTRKLVVFRTPSTNDQQMSAREVVDRITSPESKQKVARFPRSLLARWRSIMLPHVGFGGVSEGNSIKVYHDGSACYRDMWTAISEASFCIKMEAYTFEPDVVGLHTLELLEQAAKRGVQVQLIYDAWGSVHLEDRHVAPLREAGGSVVSFAPLMRFSGRGFMFRNHRKLLLVDHKVAFAGGMNMGKEYAEEDVGGTGYYRDTHLQLHGREIEKEPTHRSWCACRFEVRKFAVRLESGEGTTRAFLSFSLLFLQKVKALLSLSLPLLSFFLSLSLSLSLSLDRRLPKKTHKQQRRDGEKRELPGPCVLDFDIVFQDSLFEAYFSNPSLARRLGLVLPSRGSWLWSWLTFPQANYERARQFACAHCPPLATPPTPDTTTEPTTETTTATIATPTATVTTTATSSTPLTPANATTAATDAVPTHLDAQPLDADVNVFSSSSSSSSSSLDPSLPSSSDPSLSSSSSSFSSSSSSADNTSSSSSSSTVTAAPSPQSHIYNDIPLQVLQSNVWREKYEIQSALCLALSQSKHRCYITNPYFLPPPRMKRALRNAIRRHGSDVRVLMAGAGFSDVPVVQWACQHVYYYMLKHGARVFELQGKVLHAKIVTVDGVYGSVGSFNFDNFSDHCNLELAVSAVMSPEFTAELERQFLVDLSHAREITLQTLEQRPWYMKLCHAVAYYITQAPTMLPWYPAHVK